MGQVCGTQLPTAMWLSMVPWLWQNPGDRALVGASRQKHVDQVGTREEWLQKALSTHFTST